MSEFVLYTYETAAGKTVCHAYTRDSTGPLSQAAAAAAGKKLQSSDSGIGYMVLPAELFPGDAPAASAAALHPATAALLRFFGYEHLPPELQVVSKPFGDLARTLAVSNLEGAELTTGLRKLLEAKDCIVRAALSG